MLEDRAPRSAEKRPSDWICQHCGYSNFETNDACKRCKQDHGDAGEHQRNQARAFLDYNPQKKARREAANPLLDLARELDEEKRKRALAEMQRSRKLLFVGDVRGQYEQAFKMAAMQDKKVGPFEAVFCVGSFMPELGTSFYTDSADAHLTGEKVAPIACYFIDTSPALLQAAPQGMTLGKNLHFLGAYGVRIICGLRIAFLSGRYDAAVYNTLDADFIGGAYTKRVVSKLVKLITDSQKCIDVLLTSDWPANITKHLTDVTHKPPEVPDVHSWEVVSAPPIADLCQVVEPRYHVFASAHVFYQRPPFQTRHGRLACRCLGLGSVGGPCTKQQKWIHALSLSPAEHMSGEELSKQLLGSTESPFANEEKEHEHEVVAALVTLGNVKLHEQTLTCLAAGDLQQYLQLAEKLKGSRFIARDTVHPASGSF